MGKFRTTSSSLFNKSNNNQVPDWMVNLTENLEIKDKKVEFAPEQPKGAFAQMQSVYRPEGDASLRKVAHSYHETKLIADSKIELAKFLTGKYYKVKNAYAGTSGVTLEVHIDGVASQFQFPYEVRNGKLATASLFFGNEGEYPFSKAGFEECLLDIKTNKTKTPKVVEAVGKTFLINREEIVRRFNGSLRQATDRINELLGNGVIVGAGSNVYASFHDVDQLFPQMEKEAAEERMAEFHQVPNQEHVAPNEYRAANVLSIDASKILSKHFSDFIINASTRDGNELLVKATVLNNSNIRSTVDFSFGIEAEKVTDVKVAEVNDKRMSLSQLIDYLNEGNDVLSQYSKHHKVASKKIYDNIVFTRKDVKERLGKVIAASKVDRVIDSWVAKSLVTPINSTTFTTSHTFEELLAKTKVAKVLTAEEISEIQSYERYFGEGLNVERDEKEILERVREATDAEISDETKLASLQNTLSRQFRNFTISNFRKEASIYKADLLFVNDGVRNRVEVTANFEDRSPIVTALISNRQITIDKLAQAFERSPLLNAYLTNSNSNLVAQRAVMNIDSISRKLASIVGENEVENVIKSWLNNNLLINLGENKYASEHSFEELLQLSNVAAISESELSQRIAKQKRDRGMEVRSNHLTDTGVREAEESWSPERMTIHASQKIGSMFKDYELTNVTLSDNSYTIEARIVNPINGLKNKLKFTFSMVNGLPKELSSVANDTQTVKPEEIINLLETTDEAVKQFANLNSVSQRSYSNIINRSRLESQLKTVASAENVSNLVNFLVESKILNSISANEFTSDKSMSEIVAYLSQQAKTNVEEGKEQLGLSGRNEHRLDLRGQHVTDTDTRALEAKELKLSPQMEKVQANLEKAVIIAEKAKKITANKSALLKAALSEAKSEKDLDAVTKELRKYLN